MAYYPQETLAQMGFASLGTNVRISDKASLYEVHRMHIGDNSRIDDFCVISGGISLGRNVHIAPFCLLAGGTPGITMADFSGLAYRVSVFAQSDDYSGATMTNPTVPADYKSETLAPVHIGRHCIVGAGTVIAPGADLGEGCCVGAMSLVLKPADAWMVYAGVPARRIKDRSRDLLELERRYRASEAASQG
ncbi:acyltransferase [Leisingera sp. ANG-M7]|uniref:acyltransferase n=1 Tax=Leisingera sp. ANG-M7 TaxID=1577902 RepID=UPI00057C9113|nr:acyltransferase [Leisingera sp. ANG-M7]KIC35830.1 hypothetical protein RA26_16210 [Leisingera sp. ANG-M7]